MAGERQDLPSFLSVSGSHPRSESKRVPRIQCSTSQSIVFFLVVFVFRLLKLIFVYFASLFQLPAAGEIKIIINNSDVVKTVSLISDTDRLTI